MLKMSSNFVRIEIDSKRTFDRIPGKASGRKTATITGKAKSVEEKTGVWNGVNVIFYRQMGQEGEC